MTSQAMALPFPQPIEKPGTRWFSLRGCVCVEGNVTRVFAGGTLVGEFGPHECGLRNVLLIGLSSEPTMHLGHLSEAFDMSTEALRQLRRLYETEGLAAVWRRTPGRPKGSKLSASLRKRLEKLFEQGSSISAAHEKACGTKGRRISRSSVYRARTEWLARQQAGAAPEATQAVEPATLPLALVPPPVEAASAAAQGDAAAAPAGDNDEAGGGAAVHDSGAAPKTAACDNGKQPKDTPVTPGSEEEDRGARVRIPIAEPTSVKWVQHVGAWLMVAMVARYGLHREAEALRKAEVKRGALRIALDATIIALSLGQKCVEGVRRLATSSATALLLATQPPSATWVRRVLGRFSEDTAGPHLHLAMAGAYLREAGAEAEGEPVAFYVDNHLRHYTGKHRLRRGWSMQDKRALPGAIDYWVHDEDGRPVLRVPVPDNAPLTAVLTSIASLIRLALGAKQRILLVFDRAGAFPEHLADLRDANLDFVTYERKPYQKLASTAFPGEACFRGETVGVNDGRTNLGAGRGRVRRVALHLPDGRQLNLLAVSSQPASRLIEAMGFRWNQENAFKHGSERWGINQLDGRTVEGFAPDTIIPNPARRRLDRALKLARLREGQAHRALARLPKSEPSREEVTRELTEALRQQEELEAQRPSTPTHAPLGETELAGTLVHHTSEYKTTLDTLRTACANAESDLAGELATHLRRPPEAKRVLHNLLSAPGSISVGARSITVTLSPAGTRNEMKAFAALLRVVSRWGLTHPGDPKHRCLHFKTQDL